MFQCNFCHSHFLLMFVADAISPTGFKHIMLIDRLGTIWIGDFSGASMCPNKRCYLNRTPICPSKLFETSLFLQSNDFHTFEHILNTFLMTPLKQICFASPETTPLHTSNQSSRDVVPGWDISTKAENITCVCTWNLDSCSGFEILIIRLRACMHCFTTNAAVPLKTFSETPLLLQHERAHCKHFVRKAQNNQYVKQSLMVTCHTHWMVWRKYRPFATTVHCVSLNQHTRLLFISFIQRVMQEKTRFACMQYEAHTSFTRKTCDNVNPLHWSHA